MTAPAMTVDDAMTAIVNAADEHAAVLMYAGLPPRILRGLADLLHLDTGGRRETLTRRIIAEAQA